MKAADVPAEAAAQVREAVSPLREAGRRLLIAIDGRCAAGKSTLAARLAEELPCHLVHADDFYLHPSQRTRERYGTPGGNLDYERLAEEVLLPWVKDGAFSLRPYDAHRDVYGETQETAGGDILLIEGSYSMHPVLRGLYDLRIFLSTDPETQRRRILARNGPAALEMFMKKWIPLEELYFSSCRPEEESHLHFST